MGAALIAAWTGGTGIASATEDTSPVDTGSGCEAPILAAAEGDLTDVEGTSDDEGTVEGDPIHPEPCDTGTDPDAEVWVDVLPDGDCADPETFTFVVNATGLEAGVTYTLLLGSEDIDFTYPDGQPVFVEDIEADAQGAIKGYSFTETEGADFSAPSTGISFAFALAEGFGTDDGEFLGFGEAGLKACETEPVVVPAEPTHPVATPVAAAPVVVTHPAAAQPAVLANTGSPVTTAALLGGGLLVAGTGALVATRRRAS
ncbi:LPXTG cell wall anchor domain-containing protein [Klenkia soli]|uniref:LPXTG cell wall anchor domain-containing protein n=1 Tax=Klenkia soli TaxID=1052260 RepID=UPI000B84D8B3|nr:LPXTG cell wall anchor domain-containing protein [Klenkia soli]